MPDLRLRGGHVESNGSDVSVHVPTANLQAQALMTSEQTHALLVPKDREPSEALLCSRCKGSEIVLMVAFPGGDGYDLRVCRDCIIARPPGHPLIIDIEKA